MLFGVNAQDSTIVEHKINFTLSGFVKSDYWFESRQIVQAREGLVALYPLPVIYDAKGKDINAIPNYNFSAISSRIGLKFTGPNSFGAKTSAYIEGDFTGMSNATINMLRLRHAWIKMEWEKTTILMGQFWHPCFVTEVYPGVLALNTGAPFQPFIRSPQIRIDYKFGKMKFIATALSQRDYSSNGPIGKNYSYLSNSMIPNLDARLQFQFPKNLIGALIDWKSIRPRLSTDSNIITNEKLNTTSFMVYHRYAGKNLTIKNKIIYGQNLSEHLLLGGYAVISIDSINDIRHYSSTRHIFSWTHFSYTLKRNRFDIEPGIFIGYALNLGTEKPNTGVYYATGANLDYLFRIAPSVNFKFKPVMLSIEWEITQAGYGDINAQGSIDNVYPVTNQGVTLSAFYFF